MVGEEGFAPEEGGVFGNGFAAQEVARQGGFEGFEGFDGGEVEGDFGVDDRIEGQSRAVRGEGVGGYRQKILSMTVVNM